MSGFVKKKLVKKKRKVFRKPKKDIDANVLDNLLGVIDMKVNDLNLNKNYRNITGNALLDMYSPNTNFQSFTNPKELVNLNSGYHLPIKHEMHPIFDYFPERPKEIRPQGFVFKGTLGGGNVGGGMRPDAPPAFAHTGSRFATATSGGEIGGGPPDPALIRATEVLRANPTRGAEQLRRGTARAAELRAGRRPSGSLASSRFRAGSVAPTITPTEREMHTIASSLPPVKKSLISRAGSTISDFASGFFGNIDILGGDVNLPASTSQSGRLLEQFGGQPILRTGEDFGELSSRTLPEEIESFGPTELARSSSSSLDEDVEERIRELKGISEGEEEKLFKERIKSFGEGLDEGPIGEERLASEILEDIIAGGDGRDAVEEATRILLNTARGKQITTVALKKVVSDTVSKIQTDAGIRTWAKEMLGIKGLSGKKRGEMINIITDKLNPSKNVPQPQPTLPPRPKKKKKKKKVIREGRLPSGGFFVLSEEQA